MEDLLKSLLYSIFPAMDSTKISCLVEAILLAGVEQESDLTWITEDDVKSLLTPVQVRKFIASLRLKYGKSFAFFCMFLCVAVQNEEPHTCLK